MNAAIRFAIPLVRELIAQPSRIADAVQTAWKIFRSGGLGALRIRLIERSETTRSVSYDNWLKEFDRLTIDDRKAIAARISQLLYRPRISVIMPVYNAPDKWLRRAIDSVREQIYPDWELCIADDASTKPHVRRILEQAAASDQRIKVIYRPKNGHISAASNTALKIATGDFVVLLDHDDELAPHALYMVAEELSVHADADLIYSDEDKIDERGHRYDPFFKPDWNPDLLDSINYVAHLTCLRTSLAREVGAFRAGVEGSQDFDLILRASTRAKRIRHIPHVLYHWRSIDGSTATRTVNKDYAQSAGLKALRGRYPGYEVLPGPLPTTYRVRRPLPPAPPLVSLLIPTRDGYALLEQAVRSILEKTTYRHYELVIVDNQSSDLRTLEYLEGLRRSGKARILRYDFPFNYSRINNFAVREARGEAVALLNDDIEVIEPDWLTEMVSHALRPEIGAVGCKLLYPNRTIQHAGVLMGLFGVAGHVFRGLPEDAPGYFGRAQLTQNLSACTAACLVVRKSVYDEVGGLDEKNLPVAFNDIDFCLRLIESGYRNLYTPFAMLFHHESATRGHDETPEKRDRFRRETEFMRRRWGRKLDRDGAYNPNLSLRSLYTELAWPSRAQKPWKHG
jgi:glycosyltransferase involved in cell wall biosynthesis